MAEKPNTDEEIKGLFETLNNKVKDGIMSETDARKEYQEKTDKTLSDFKEKIKSLQGATANIPGYAGTKECDTFSFAKSIYGQASGDWNGAEMEKEILGLSKAAATNTGVNGGLLVPIENSQQIIELLTDNTALLQAGVTQITADGNGGIDIPKESSDTTAYWLEENEDIPESEMTFEQVSMRPHAVAGLSVFSMQLLKRSNPSIEKVVRRSLARKIGLAIDDAGLFGSGSKKVIRGLANTLGADQKITSSEQVTYDLLLRMEGKVDDANALMLGGTHSYVGHGSTYRSLKTQKVAQYDGDTGGQPIYAPIVSSKLLQEAVGYNLTTASQISKHVDGTDYPFFFGDFSQMMMAFWQGITLDSDSGGKYFAKNQVAVKAFAELDMAVAHKEAFCMATKVQRASGI